MKKGVLDPRDRDAIVTRYRNRITEHGVSLESMASGGWEKQKIRHQVHATAIQGTHPTVLEIGCGLGQLCQHLVDVGRACSFTGYDIVPEYVEHCEARFPDSKFEARNVFEDGIGVECDTIVASQVLNNCYRHSDNREVMKNLLSMAYESTRVSVSVDMLSTYVDFQDPELHYYSPEEIFEFAKSLTRRVRLLHDYRPWEFAVQLFHPEADGYVP